VRTLSFVIHNFMDSCALERDRIDACVFKVMTAEGPISMCMHNAKRDSFILQPVRMPAPGGNAYWQPLTGEHTPERNAPAAVRPAQHTLKKLKGLTRERFLAGRE